MARTTSLQFERFLSAWVATRMPSSPTAEYEAAVVTNAALAVLHVAFFTWVPERGASQLEQLIRRGFDAVTAFQVTDASALELTGMRSGR
jgi:hypothetical protein